MADTKEQAEWRAHFEKIDEGEVRKLVHSSVISEPIRRFGFQWLGEREHDQQVANAEHRVNERIMARWTRNLGGVTIVLAIIAAVTAWIAYQADQTSRLRDRALIY